MATKRCSRCRLRLPFDAFKFRSAPYSNQRMPWCQDCKRAYDRQRSAARRAAARAARAAFISKEPEHAH